MSSWTRRSFIGAAGASLAACTSQPNFNETPRQRLDTTVRQSLEELYRSVPGASQLASRAEGILVVPQIRKVGFFASGAYGEGALLIGPATVDYYSLSAAGFGFTFGAAEYNQALFFLTPAALQEFRTADGWELTAGAAYALPSSGGAAAGIASSRINLPIQEVVYGQRGLIADASFAGGKYSRIVR